MSFKNEYPEEAGESEYDNSGTSLGSETVQDAVSELAGATVTGTEGVQGGGAIDTDPVLKLDVNGLAVDATPDGAADYVATYDDSAGVHKKVLLDDLPGGGGGGGDHAASHEVGGGDLVNHDSLTGFVGNEHVDHSAVSITASEGVQGGGDLTATRNVKMDVNGLVEETTPVLADDFIPFYDTSAGLHRKTKFEDIPTQAANLAVVYPVTLNDAPAGGVSLVEVDELSAYELPDGSDDKGVSFLFVLTDQINLSTDPKMRFDLYIFATGSGNDNADFELTCKYISVGELTSKTADEVLPVTVAITDTEKQRHVLVFTLDRTLIATTDALYLNMKRLGSSDDYEGTICVATQGGLEFGT